MSVVRMYSYTATRTIGEGDVYNWARAAVVVILLLFITWRCVMALLILTDEQKCSVSVAFKTDKGNPAPVDGVPVWASSNEATVVVTPAADGLSAELTTPGGLGVAQISVKADADLGAGTTEITGLLDVEVKPAGATIVEIVPGTPTVD